MRPVAALNVVAARGHGRPTVEPAGDEEVHPAPPVRLGHDGSRFAADQLLHQVGQPPPVVAVHADGVELHARLAEVKSGVRNPLGPHPTIKCVHETIVTPIT